MLILKKKQIRKQLREETGFPKEEIKIENRFLSFMAAKSDGAAARSRTEGSRIGRLLFLSHKNPIKIV